MSNNWQAFIDTNGLLVAQNAGPGLVAVVSGNIADSDFWKRHMDDTKRNVLGADGNTLIIPVAEITPKGNFLGTLSAWDATIRALSTSDAPRPPMMLMSMLFGKGKRLSPFTQALGERKSAFPTPRRSTHSQFNLRTADLSHLCTASLMSYLEQQGFRGALIKWGDEALIPGVPLQSAEADLRQVDAVRFVSKRNLSHEIAREKEWVLYDGQSGQMQRQLTRQGIHDLQDRVRSYGLETSQLAVNLGSLAVSDEFLNLATSMLAADLADPARRVDWDPYVWVALFCSDEEEWRAEIEHENRIGKPGIHELQARYPDFFPKMHKLRRALEHQTGRPLTVATLDFGDVLWIDYGLHLSLRKSLESLVEDTQVGQATRHLFDIPQVRDARGNTIIRSQVPIEADIRDSVILDSVILNERSVMHGAVVIGGRHRRLHMPHGGSALFCAADQMSFLGPHAVALRSTGREFTLHEGTRHTCLFMPGSVEPLESTEAILDYSASNYSEPILGNRLSFEQAGEIMSRLDGHDLEALWANQWSTWLPR